MARLNNDRSPKLHKEVHCTLVVRESTIECAVKSEEETLSMPRASLAAKPFGGLWSNGTERLLPSKQSGYFAAGDTSVGFTPIAIIVLGLLAVPWVVPLFY